MDKKNIDFKQPRYILPLVILPFILLIAYVVQGMNFGKEEVSTNLEEVQEVNSNIQTADLSRRKEKSKLGALKDAFQKSADFSSIQEINPEEKNNEVEDKGSLYSNTEMRTIDSLNTETRIKKSEMDKQKANYKSDYKGDEFDSSLQNVGEERERNAPKKSKTKDEMDVFKQQMKYIDSIQNPQKYVSKRTIKKAEKNEDTSESVAVLKANNPAASFFNTVSENKFSNDIAAIIDETIKIVSGSRVRIRLLDDVIISNGLIKKGSYLYGNVSGFRSQRVAINITSIMVSGKRTKVNLSIFDNDGQEGLFVPSSAFRDLTKNIGSQAGSQNIQIEQQSNTAAEFAIGALQDAYRSTTQAISKEVKKNKAVLKYNTQVFLINTKEKETQYSQTEEQ